MPIGTVVAETELPRYVAAPVMCNDISARDVQLEQGQFYESKSYPTSTPTGPRLVLPEPQDFSRLSGLRLRLWVNGQPRTETGSRLLLTERDARLPILRRTPVDVFDRPTDLADR